jgi:hypothetical protein
VSREDVRALHLPRAGVRDAAAAAAQAAEPRFAGKPPVHVGRGDARRAPAPAGGAGAPVHVGRGDARRAPAPAGGAGAPAPARQRAPAPAPGFGALRPGEAANNDLLARAARWLETAPRGASIDDIARAVPRGGATGALEALLRGDRARFVVDGDAGGATPVWLVSVLLAEEAAAAAAGAGGDDGGDGGDGGGGGGDGDGGGEDDELSAYMAQLGWDSGAREQ